MMSRIKAGDHVKFSILRTAGLALGQDVPHRIRRDRRGRFAPPAGVARGRTGCIL
jgi:hypothetical protein